MHSVADLVLPLEILCVNSDDGQCAIQADWVDRSGYPLKCLNRNEVFNALNPAAPQILILAKDGCEDERLRSDVRTWRTRHPQLVTILPAGKQVNQGISTALIKDRVVCGVLHIDTEETFVLSELALFTELAQLRVTKLVPQAAPTDDRSSRTLEAIVQSRTEQLRTRNRRLEYLATRDPLTGLHNRRYLENRLEGEISRFQRYGTPFSLVVLDLDDFKQVNDVHGHPAGDAVLGAVAKHLLRKTRKVDCVGRFGGEEFLAILPNATLAQAEIMATRLCQTLSESPVPLEDGRTLTVTISGGVAQANQSDDAWPGVFRRADTALYVAKKDGKNCIRLEAPQESAAQ